MRVFAQICDMALKYPHLFTPITIGNQVFRNRLFSSPIGFQYHDAASHNPTREAIAFFSRRAKGGAASVALGECMVDSVHGKSNPTQVSLDNVNSRASMTAMAMAISEFGAVPTVELQHAGKYAVVSLNAGNDIYGPNEEPFPWAHRLPKGAPIPMVKAMDEAMIEHTINAFADAALFAKRCGFGMVLVHGGHGWLLTQFLSPMVNKRTDRWGGSVENRARIAVAICDAIHKKCGTGFPVEFRMSGSECNPTGYGIDEGIAIAKQLDGHADLIHVSAGDHNVPDTFTVVHPNMFLPDGANLQYAAAIKKEVKTPVATVGAFVDPAMMEEVIAAGQADVVECARELICDPDMPIKARMGRDGEISHCMRCFTCFSNLVATGQICCAINPEIGQELTVEAPVNVSRSKKVLVAGGGPGGMQAALTASSYGHKVILCEKTDRLGGALLCEEKVPFKKRLAEYLNKQAAKCLNDPNIEVRLNTAVTPELAEQMAPDVIFAAIGAEAVVPKIPGIERALPAEYAYENAEKTGERVVILGAGLVGTEMAVYLTGLGRKVTVLEMAPAINDGGNSLQVSALNVQIRHSDINMVFNTKAVEITENGVIGEKDGERSLFEADTVVCAVGMRAKRDEAFALSACAPEFYQIGDCLAATNVRDATRTAYYNVRNMSRI
jgi:2,4-dienoyl-CoA reductase-like NADH-dependent reductase (Old Yellow Enzyme family)/thioredoxin reductase